MPTPEELDQELQRLRRGVRFALRALRRSLHNRITNEVSALMTRQAAQERELVALKDEVDRLTDRLDQLMGHDGEPYRVPPAEPKSRSGGEAILSEGYCCGPAVTDADTQEPKADKPDPKADAEDSTGDCVASGLGSLVEQLSKASGASCTAYVPGYPVRVVVADSVEDLCRALGCIPQVREAPPVELPPGWSNVSRQVRDAEVARPPEFCWTNVSGPAWGQEFFDRVKRDVSAAAIKQVEESRGPHMMWPVGVKFKPVYYRHAWGTEPSRPTQEDAKEAEQPPATDQLNDFPPGNVPPTTAYTTAEAMEKLAADPPQQEPKGIPREQFEDFIALCEEHGKPTDLTLETLIRLRKSHQDCINEVSCNPDLRRRMIETIDRLAKSQFNVDLAKSDPPKREWWIRKSACCDFPDSAYRKPIDDGTHVIPAPSDAEIEEAVSAGRSEYLKLLNGLSNSSAGDCIRHAVLHLLGRAEK